jgi:hypothetical protein
LRPSPKALPDGGGRLLTRKLLEIISAILVKVDATSDEEIEYVENMKKLDLERIYIYIELLRDELQRSKILQDIEKGHHRVHIQNVNQTNPTRPPTVENEAIMSKRYTLDIETVTQYHRTVTLLRKVIHSATGIPNWSS